MSVLIKQASCAIAIGVLAATPAAAEPRIGAVTQRDFLGAVGTRINGEVRDLLFDERVYTDEIVNTGSTATTSLVLLDDTNLFIGTSSRVVLDKFVYDPDQRVGEAAISFGKGAFRWVSGQMRNKEAITLRTPTTVMAIRGTELVIFVLDDGTSEINVLSGAVDVSPCGGGQTVSVGVGGRLLVTATCDATAAPARPIPAGHTIPVMPDDIIALPDIEPAAGPAGDPPADRPASARSENSNSGDGRAGDRPDRPEGGLRGESNPDPGTGSAGDPGNDPGNDPGSDPGNDPGKDPGSDQGNDPGNDPGKDPGSDQGNDPGPVL